MSSGIATRMYCIVLKTTSPRAIIIITRKSRAVVFNSETFYCFPLRIQIIKARKENNDHVTFYVPS